MKITLEQLKKMAEAIHHNTSHYNECNWGYESLWAKNEKYDVWSKGEHSEYLRRARLVIAAAGLEIEE